MQKKYIVFLSVLWIIAGICGWKYFSYTKEEKIKTINNNIIMEQKKNQERITIYLPDKNMRTLIKQDTEIDVPQSTKDRVFKTAEKTVQLLASENFITNKNITLFNVYFDDKTIYLDFSAEIGELDDNTSRSLLNIYSIVNSVTEISGFNRVKIMVNGNDGNRNLGKFYNRNTSI